jgi:hypothetical protein
VTRAVWRYLGRHHIALLALFLALGGTSYAVTDGFSAASSSKFHACVKKKDGAMRLLTKGRCKRTERAISWNRQGLASLPGASGSPGGTGPAGATGATPTGYHVIPLTNQTATEGFSTGVSRPLAPEVTLATRGVITLYGKCVFSGSGDFTGAELYLKTSLDGAQWNNGSTPSALDTGTAELSRMVDERGAPSTRNFGLSEPPKVIHVVAPDGTAFTTSVELGATTIGGPSALFVSTRSCFFHGYVIG